MTFEAATETYPKRLQLLKEIVPSLSRVAVLFGAGDPNVVHARHSLDAAAPALGVRLQLIEVGSASELETGFRAMRAQGAQGLVVIAGAFTFLNGRTIAALSLANHLPSSHAFRETVAAGGLVSLGPNYREMAVQVAGYVAKVLRGATPAELPVEQPSKFQLVVNLKTAQALGLVVPRSLLLRADEVIR